MSQSPVTRVLVAHNRYRHRGGEDAVVDDETALLRSAGIEVQLYERDSHDTDTMPAGRVALHTLWNRRTVAEAGALLDAFRPDVLHVHNTFPLISPSIYAAAAARGVPVVQTLHNFRLLCPQAMLLREGRPCEDCVGRLPWRGVVHGCYRGSRSQSAVLATMLATQRAAGTWQRRITRYIALNEFCRERFVAGGLPAERIRVKPNFVDLPRMPETMRLGFLYVGRLSPEKGVQVLADAASFDDVKSGVRVAGSGPDEAALAGHPRLQLLGALSPASVYEEMRRAVALVMPSLWYENFPRTLVEAYALGLPVIASRLGAMASLVEDGRTGLLFTPGNAADLAAKLRWAENHPERMAAMGLAARRRYEAEMGRDENLRRLLAIYAEAVAEVRRIPSEFQPPARA